MIYYETWKTYMWWINEKPSSAGAGGGSRETNIWALKVSRKYWFFSSYYLSRSDELCHLMEMELKRL